MTKRRFFKNISILLISLAFALGCAEMFSSCNNIAENSSSETPAVPAGIILVTASVAPENKAARFAAPDALDDVTNFDYSATLTVIGASPSSLVSGTYDTSTKKVTFSFDAPSATSGITIDIYAHSSGESNPTTSNAVLHASKPNLSISDGKIAVGTITLSKNTANTEKGSASLSVTLPSSGYTLSATCNTGTFTVEGTAPDVTVKGTNLTAGAYPIDFTIKKGDEIVYIWKEVVNIYAGMETNKWKTIANDGTVSTSDAKIINESEIEAATLTTLFVKGNGTGWYSANLPTATADDSNPGTVTRPLATVQKAIDKVKAVNDGVTEYTIYVDGTFTAASGGNVAKIEDVDKALKLSIIGLGSSKAVFKGSGSGLSANVIRVRQNDLTLNLENLKFMSANIQNDYGSGGGLHFGDNTTPLNKLNVTLKNCEISGNKARYGGGISFNGKSLNLIDCIVTENEANYGGGLIAYNGSVTLTKLSTGTIIGDSDTTKTTLPTSSDFGNKTTGNGGGITLSTNEVVLSIGDGCYIHRNYCSGQEAGGGICIQSGSTVSIADGAYIQYNFSECTIDAENKTANGGGINIASTSANVSVSGNIIGNKISVTGKKTTSSNGGGISNNGGTLTLSSTAKIENNSVTAQLASDAAANVSVTANGGGIYTTAALTIPSGVEISGNSATNGGGIYNTGTLSLTGGKISANTGAIGGGILNLGTLDFTSGTIGGDDTVDANVSPIGGGIANFNILNIKGGSVKGNIAKNNAVNQGGGIYNIGTITMTSGSISKNIVEGEATSSQGAGIYNSALSGTYGTVTIKGGTISGNNAGLGAAVFNSGVFDMQGGTIGGDESEDANVAVSAGGALYNDSEQDAAKISGGYIKGNKAALGGAIVNYKALSISGGVFSGNTTTASLSNGICNNGTSLTLSGSFQFSGDDDIFLNVDTEGTGVRPITIGGEITGTTPVAKIIPYGYGDGITVLKSDTPSILSAAVPKFTLAQPSSGTEWKINTSGNLEKVTAPKISPVYLNSATTNGGNDSNSGASSDKAVKTLKKAIELLDTNAENPTIIISSPYTLASDEINCLEFEKTVTLKRGTSCGVNLLAINKDTTGTNVTVPIKNVVFDGNKNSVPSSVDTSSLLCISASGLKATLKNVVFKNNKSQHAGGGIFLSSGGTVEFVKNVEIIDNEASTQGGGIYFEPGYGVSIEINENVTIKGNTSGTNGNGIFVASGALEFSSGANIDPSNDVYLGSNATIKITSPLTTPNAATITPATYSTDTTVLIAGTGVTLADEVGKFKVTPESNSKSWKVNVDGKLAEDTNIKNVGITDVGSFNLDELESIIEDGNVVYMTATLNDGDPSDPSSLDIYKLTDKLYSISSAKTFNLYLTLNGNISEITDFNYGYGAFYGCSCLKEVHLEDLNDLKKLGTNAFYGCENLEKIIFPTSLTTIGMSAFSGCTSIKELTIPSSVQKIYPNAFLNCTFDEVEFENKTNWYKTYETDFTGGTSIDVSYSSQNATNFKDTSDSRWNNYFIYYSEDIQFPVLTAQAALTELTKEENKGKPVNIKVKETSSSTTTWTYLKSALSSTEVGSVKLVVEIGGSDEISISAQEFYGCKALESFEIKGNLKTVPANMFGGCINLKKVVLPDTVTKIEANSFNGCAKLEEIQIPDNVTSIGTFAFSNCTSLTSITLPSNLTTIGNGAFQVCSLTSIIIPAAVTKIGQKAFFPGYVDGVLANSTLTSISFENKTNWKHTTNSEYNEGTSIVVDDSTQNVTYLTNTYVEEYWYRQ